MLIINLPIVQVREMAKANAAKIRQAVKEEHKNQMKKLSQQVQVNNTSFQITVHYTCTSNTV